MTTAFWKRGRAGSGTGLENRRQFIPSVSSISPLPPEVFNRPADDEPQRATLRRCRRGGEPPLRRRLSVRHRAQWLPCAACGGVARGGRVTCALPTARPQQRVAGRRAWPSRPSTSPKPAWPRRASWPPRRASTCRYAVAGCDDYAWLRVAFDGVAAIFIQFADPALRDGRLFRSPAHGRQPEDRRRRAGAAGLDLEILARRQHEGILKTGGPPLRFAPVHRGAAAPTPAWSAVSDLEILALDSPAMAPVDLV